MGKNVLHMSHFSVSTERLKLFLMQPLKVPFYFAVSSDRILIKSLKNKA